MNVSRRQQLKARDERASVKAELEAAYEMADHPKRDRIFEMAWERGHSCGWSEIENEYLELAELVKS